MLIKNTDIAQTERTLSRKGKAPADSSLVGAAVGSALKAPASKKEKKEETPELNLREQFKEELDALRATVKKEAIAEAMAEAETKIQEELKAKKAELDASNKERQKEFARLIDLLQEISEQASGSKKLSIQELESHVVNLTLECIYKLTGERTLYKSIVERTIKESIEGVDADTSLKIRYADRDKDLMEELELVLPDSCSLVEDAQLEPGSCLVESGYSTTDLGVFTKLDQLRDALIETYKDRRKNDL